MTKYRYEKFESLKDALMWCAENKPIRLENKNIDTQPDEWSFCRVKLWWNEWFKAIPIGETKLRKFWFWHYKTKCGKFKESCWLDKDGNTISGDGKNREFVKAKWKRKVESSLIVLDENGEVVESE